MLFDSLTFLAFFAVVFTVHLLLRGWRARKVWLLAASYFFYAAWNPPYVFILMFSTGMDWLLARAIWRSSDPRMRRLLLVVSLVANLGLLGYFKYGDFLLSNAQALMATAGVRYVPPALDIILPIGISFYTFASLSYTIDVYRGEIEGDAPWLDYALFVSFFPHLVAGPIVRARQLLPQIAAPRLASRDQLGWGLTLVIIGLFCKVTLADALFAPVVDEVYAKPAAFGAVHAWAAVLGFSWQIYFDFAGYSLCAIGLALCFGFEFPDNFHYPYAARGFSDFWHRWHITLSSWLRDYLYIPLGGNRRGERRTYLNLMLTMLIGGLWHGASWMFVLWGGLHGAYLSLERAWHGRHPVSPIAPPAWRAHLTAISVFLVISLTWIPFRAHSLAEAGGMLRGLSQLHSADAIDPGMALFYAACAVAWLWQMAQRDTTLEERFARLGTPLQAAVLGACLIGIFLCSGGDQRAFIYFQF